MSRLVGVARRFLGSRHLIILVVLVALSLTNVTQKARSEPQGPTPLPSDAETGSKEELGWVPYFYIYDTLMRSCHWLAVILFIIWLGILFSMLVISADGFFSPNLIAIADKFALGPEVAGLTILAFGNGVCDFVTNFVCFLTESPSIAFGSIIGTGLFITTIVAGCIILASKEPLRLEPAAFLRDILFYVTGLGILMVSVCTGKVWIYQPILLLGLYVAYAFCAVSNRFSLFCTARSNAQPGAPTLPLVPHPDHQQQQQQMIEEPKSLRRSRSREGVAPPINIQSQLEKHRAINNNNSDDTKEMVNAAAPLSVSLDDCRRGHQQATSPSSNETTISYARQLSFSESACHANRLSPSTGPNQEENNAIETQPTNLSQFFAAHPIFRLKKNYLGTTAHQRISNVAQFHHILCAFRVTYWIFQLPLYLTITTPEWNQFTSITSVIFAWPIFFFAIQKMNLTLFWHVPLFAVFTLLSCVVAVAIYFTSSRKTPPKYQFAFCLLAFFVCLIIMYIISEELVALVRTIGILFNIPEVVLGATLVTFGNSLTDIIVDSMLAREGRAELAFAAIYGGTMFSLSLGFGLILLTVTIRTYPMPYQAGVGAFLFLDSILILLVNVVISAIVIGALFSFRVPKKMCLFWGPYYLVYLLTITIFQR